MKETMYTLSYLYEHRLDALVPVPVSQNRQIVGVHGAVRLVDERQIDSGKKADRRRPVRIILATGDLDAVNAVLVYSLTGDK